MTTGTVLSRVHDTAGMVYTARISGARRACPRSSGNDRESALSIQARRQPRWLLKAAALILGAVLVAGCTVQVQVSLPPTSVPSSPGASPSSPATTSSNCSGCEQLMSEFPVLAAIGLSELENLLEKYGPDLAALLYAAEFLFDL
jgi:hypothetical protein